MNMQSDRYLVPVRQAWIVKEVDEEERIPLEQPRGYNRRILKPLPYGYTKEPEYENSFEDHIAQRDKLSPITRAWIVEGLKYGRAKPQAQMALKCEAIERWLVKEEEEEEEEEDIKVSPNYIQSTKSDEIEYMMGFALCKETTLGIKDTLNISAICIDYLSGPSIYYQRWVPQPPGWFRVGTFDMIASPYTWGSADAYEEWRPDYEAVNFELEEGNGIEIITPPEKWAEFFNAVGLASQSNYLAYQRLEVWMEINSRKTGMLLARRRLSADAPTSIAHLVTLFEKYDLVFDFQNMKDSFNSLITVLLNKPLESIEYDDIKEYFDQYNHRFDFDNYTSVDIEDGYYESIIDALEVLCANDDTYNEFTGRYGIPFVKRQVDFINDLFLYTYDRDAWSPINYIDFPYQNTTIFGTGGSGTYILSDRRAELVYEWYYSADANDTSDFDFMYDWEFPTVWFPQSNMNATNISAWGMAGGMQMSYHNPLSVVSAGGFPMPGTQGYELGFQNNGRTCRIFGTGDKRERMTNFSVHGSEVNHYLPTSDTEVDFLYNFKNSEKESIDESGNIINRHCVLHDEALWRWYAVQFWKFGLLDARTWNHVILMRENEYQSLFISNSLMEAQLPFLIDDGWEYLGKVGEYIDNEESEYHGKLIIHPEQPGWDKEHPDWDYCWHLPTNDEETDDEE